MLPKISRNRVHADRRSPEDWTGHVEEEGEGKEGGCATSNVFFVQRNLLILSNLFCLTSEILLLGGSGVGWIEET